jgi:hypothetical protein
MRVGVLLFGALRAPSINVKEIKSDKKIASQKEIERRLKMKSIRNRILTVVAVGLLSVAFGASASQAQAIYKGSFTLDHTIRWQKSTMPAGDYTFTVASTSRNQPVTVTGPDGSVFQLPMVVSNTKITEKSVLKLEWRGEDMFVREMDLGQVGLNIRYHVPKASADDKLLAKNHDGSEQILIAMTTAK